VLEGLASATVAAVAVAGRDLYDAERIVRSAPHHSPWYEGMELRHLAVAVAGHDLAEAERIARTVTDSYQQSVALREIAVLASNS
jgi:hypothetical protein